MHNSAHMCLATDAMNVAAWAPFQMIWMVTTGKTLIPGVTGVPADQRLTRTEALQHYTAECAWFMDQDGRLGSLEPGYHADLSSSTRTTSPSPDDQVKDIKSVLTIVGGRIVYTDGTLETSRDARRTRARRRRRHGPADAVADARHARPRSARSRPGVGKDYTASTTATVISTAGDATLSVADPSATAHRPSGQRHVRAAAGAAGQGDQPRRHRRRYAAVGGSAAPTTLLTYGGPVSQRRGDDRLQADDRRQRRAAHGHLQRRR